MYNVGGLSTRPLIPNLQGWRGSCHCFASLNRFTQMFPCSPNDAGTHVYAFTRSWLQCHRYFNYQVIKFRWFILFSSDVEQNGSWTVWFRHSLQGTEVQQTQRSGRQFRSAVRGSGVSADFLLLVPFQIRPVGHCLETTRSMIIIKA